MATSHNGIDVTPHMNMPTPEMKQRLSNALQRLRYSANALGNAAAARQGIDPQQKVNRNHGNNPVNNLSQG